MYSALRDLRAIMSADLGWSADMRELAKINVNLAVPRVDLAGRATSGRLLEMLGGYESATDRAAVTSYAARIMAERKNQDVWRFQALVEAYQAQAALERTVACLYPANAVKVEFALGDLLDERLRDARTDAGVPAKPASATHMTQHGAMSPKPEAEAHAIAPKPKVDIETQPPLKPKPKPAAKKDVAKPTALAKPPAKRPVPKPAKPTALRRRRHKPRRIATDEPAMRHECREASVRRTSFSLPILERRTNKKEIKVMSQKRIKTTAVGDAFVTRTTSGEGTNDATKRIAQLTEHRKETEQRRKEILDELIEIIKSSTDPTWNLSHLILEINDLRWEILVCALVGLGFPPKPLAELELTGMESILKSWTSSHREEKEKDDPPAKNP